MVALTFRVYALCLALLMYLGPLKWASSTGLSMSLIFMGSKNI